MTQSFAERQASFSRHKTPSLDTFPQCHSILCLPPAICQGVLFFPRGDFYILGNWAGQTGANIGLTATAMEPGLPQPLKGVSAATLSSPGASAGGTVSPAHPLRGFSAPKGIFLLDKE